jgi:hypothetical protein
VHDQRRIIFSLSRGLKFVLCLLEYLLTPATILRRAISENVNAFSVHVTGFKHKIYRWLCFRHNERSDKWDGSRKNSRSCFFYPSLEIEMFVV